MAKKSSKSSGKSINAYTQRLKKRFITVLVLVVLLCIVGFVFLPARGLHSLLSRTFGADSPLTALLMDLKGNQNEDDDNEEDENNANENNGDSTKVVDNNKSEEIVIDEKFGFPAIGNYDQVVRHTAYTLVYDEKNEQALWVAHKLEAKKITGRAERGNNFRPDPDVRTGSALSSDYSRSGYDRGHLAPAGDFTQSEKVMSESFFMSNMSPQVPELNRGKWREMEEQIRYWVKMDKEYYIVTGPVFKGKMKKIGSKTKVTVPKAYFKVVLDMNHKKAIAFMMPNEPIDHGKELKDFVVTIDEVEKETGLNFFPELDKNKKLEKQLEGNVNVNEWF